MCKRERAGNVAEPKLTNLFYKKRSDNTAKDFDAYVTSQTEREDCNGARAGGVQ